MNFFQYYTTTPYTFATANDTPSYTLTMVNTTQRAKIAARIGDYTSVTYDYVIEGDQRPDNVALRVYGDVKYTWLILLLNNINSLYDWPLDSAEFGQYITARYGSLSRAQATTTEHYYYFTQSGAYVTREAYLALPEYDRGEALPARYCYIAEDVRIDSESYDTLSAAQRGDVKTPYIYELEQNELRRRIKVVNRAFLSKIEQELRTLFS